MWFPYGFRRIMMRYQPRPGRTLTARSRQRLVGLRCGLDAFSPRARAARDSTFYRVPIRGRSSTSGCMEWQDHYDGTVDMDMPDSTGSSSRAGRCADGAAATRTAGARRAEIAPRLPEIAPRCCLSEPIPIPTPPPTPGVGAAPLVGCAVKSLLANPTLPTFTCMHLL